jgi:predicted phosphodiesterase
VLTTSRAADPVAAYEQATLHGWNGGGALVREFGPTPRQALRAYVRRMAPDGDVGRWLRCLAPLHVAEVAGARVLLTHGDVAEPLRSPRALARYAGRLRRVLDASAVPGARRDHPAFRGDDGILWSRAFSELDPADAGEAARICASVGADIFVTGHTPHDGVTSYGGRIFDVDVGMAPAYGESEPEALVFDGERVVAVSASGRERTLATLVSVSAAA